MEPLKKSDVDEYIKRKRKAKIAGCQAVMRIRKWQSMEEGLMKYAKMMDVDIERNAE